MLFKIFNLNMFKLCNTKNVLVKNQCNMLQWRDEIFIFTEYEYLYIRMIIIKLFRNFDRV